MWKLLEIFGEIVEVFGETIWSLTKQLTRLIIVNYLTISLSLIIVHYLIVKFYRIVISLQFSFKYISLLFSDSIFKTFASLNLSFLLNTQKTGNRLFRNSKLKKLILKTFNFRKMNLVQKISKLFQFQCLSVSEVIN